MCSVALEIQGLNPTGKSAEEDAVGFAKSSPKNHACPKYLAAHRCGSAFQENGLFHQELDELGKTLVD